MRPMIKDPFARLGLDREVLTVSQLNGRARCCSKTCSATSGSKAKSQPGPPGIRPRVLHAQGQRRPGALRTVPAERCASATSIERRPGGQGTRQGLAVRGARGLPTDPRHRGTCGRWRVAAGLRCTEGKLSAEGLFSAERKVPLPAHPQRIGIISSPTGAVIRDIISVFHRRAPQIQLTLIPTAVQGREATAQIVRALKLADARGFDALILARVAARWKTSGASTKKPWPARWMPA